MSSSPFHIPFLLPAPHHALPVSSAGCSLFPKPPLYLQPKHTLNSSARDCAKHKNHSLIQEQVATTAWQLQKLPPLLGSCREGTPISPHGGKLVPGQSVQSNLLLDEAAAPRPAGCSPSTPYLVLPKKSSATFRAAVLKSFLPEEKPGR